MHNACILLIKKQLIDEVCRAISRMTADSDLVGYLKGEERDKIVACNTEADLDAYLSRSKRMSLAYWMDSLKWEHIRGYNSW